MAKAIWMVSTGIASGILLASAAQAQTANPGTARPEVTEAANESGLEDIVVTAQRRSENLQRAALAVSAVSGDDLRNASINTPAQLTSLVPALQIGSAGGTNALFYLRGVGNFSANALSDSAVAFNFANTVISRPSGTSGFFYDLDRIEVLKGPQGTLYGRNATGGAINVIPNAAKIGELSGSVIGEYGNYDAIRVEGAINVPLGQSAALRAAAVYVKHDGYISDGTSDQDDLSGRLSLRLAPTDDLTIDIVGDYTRQRGNGSGSTLFELGVDRRLGLTSPEARAYYASQPNFVLGRNFVGLTSNPYIHNDSWGLSSTIDWNVSIGTITLIPAYRSTDQDYLTLAPGFQLANRERDTQASFEARFASDDSKPLRFILGTFVFDEKVNDKGFRVNAQANGSNQFYRTRTKSMAAFGRVTYAPVPEVRLTVGGRFTTEDKTFDGSQNAYTRICLNPPTFFPVFALGCPTAQIVPLNDFSIPPPDFNPFPDGTITVPNVFSRSSRASFERVTYRLAADWDLTNQNMVYASYETGFKSGGFFNAPGRNTFQPEKIAAYTIGSKNRFFDNRLQINLEAFYWIYRDQQLSHLGLDDNGNTIFPTENVGKATVKGIEAEISFSPVRNTLLSADIQYLDSVYDDFVYRTPNQNNGANNGTSCPNQSVTATAYTVNCSGNRPPNSPTWTINLAGRQSFDLSGGGKITLDARGHYQSRTLTGLEFLASQYQDAFWTADASITFSAPDDRFFVTGFINNAFDKTVLSNSFPVPFSSFNSVTLRPPRTYGIRAGTRF